MKKIVVKNLLLHILVLFAVFCIILCSCGFKGPLYLPKKAAASSPQKSASGPTKTASSQAAINIINNYSDGYCQHVLSSNLLNKELNL
ncbi:MAG TPA: lipoprotein [Aquella sp.]|nr:lipoprotein [Aquella sp.]